MNTNILTPIKIDFLNSDDAKLGRFSFAAKRKELDF